MNVNTYKYCLFMPSDQGKRFVLPAVACKKEKNVWSLASPRCSLVVDFSPEGD